MKFTTAALVAALAAAVSAKDSRTFAVLRFTNKQLTKGRMDPIVNPGGPSPHTHTIMGGSGFSWSATGEDLMASQCTNAQIKGDNSAYWFPSMYFKDPETGSFESVEVFYVNVYYFFEATNDEIQPFPVGLHMISGENKRRTPPPSGETNLDPSRGEVTPVKFTCPRSSFDPPSWPADSDGTMAGMGDPINKGEGAGFPFANCDGYASPLRADIHFPSCYNPEAGLSTTANNTAFPTSAGDGKVDCPEGWVHLPHLFFEVYWNTPLFADRWTPFEGSQPFVLSNGDATGYGSHADFMAAWDEPLLKHIIDTCDAGSSGMVNCDGLFYGVNEEDCTIPSQIDEQVDGVMDALPGTNILQGWSYGLDGTAPVEEPTEEPVEEPTPTGLPEEDSPATDIVENPVTEPTATQAPDVESPPATEEPEEDSDEEPVEAPVEAPVDAPEPTPSQVCRAPVVHTVWETVTITGAAPAPSDADPYAKAKRDHIRRHAHHHM